MDILLDTHTLAWLGAGSPKLSRAARDAIESVDASLFVSSVIAFEYSDLLNRDRLPSAARLERLIDDFELVLLDYPGELWRVAENLPEIHRDPIDRMLIAHGIHLNYTVVTVDGEIHRYPVKTLW